MRAKEAFSRLQIISIRDACDKNGNTNVDNLKTAWQTQITNYNALSEEVKTILKEASDSHQNKILKNFLNYMS